MTVPVLTISNRDPDPVRESYYHLPAFKESCKRQGFSPIFMPCLPYRGLMTKPKKTLEFLEKEGAKWEHVIICDAWDIVFLAGPDEIIYNWKGLGAPIVFNAERNCFPVPEFEKAFTAICPYVWEVLPQGSAGQTPIQYRFLNSGFICGVTEAIVQMLREMDLENAPDDDPATGYGPNDQEGYQRWFLQHHEGRAALDYRGILCHSLHDSTEREFTFRPEQKRVVSMLTHNEPCVFHGNGSGKAWLERIIRWLGL